MTITRLNPDGLHSTPGYHHVTVVEAGRLAFLAGQCPLDVSGTVAGLDGALDARIDAQVDQVAANALTALGAVGASPSDVVRSVVYVVSTEAPVLSRAWHRFANSAIGAAFSTASTLVGVAQLGFGGQLIELDLTAALPG